MEEKQFLNEEKYQVNKNKLRKVAKNIMIIGTIIGLCVIGIGLYISLKDDNTKSTTNQTTNQTSTTPTVNVSDLKEELAEVKTNINKLNQSANKEFMANGYSDKYNSLSTELSTLRDRELNLDSQIANLEASQEFDKAVSENKQIFNSFIGNNNIGGLLKAPLVIMSIIPGIVIIIISLIVGGILMLIAHQRDIAAFQAQSSIPVVKEVIDDVTPTIAEAGKTVIEGTAPAFGNMAKEISKGIKEGLKDEDKE